MGSAYCEGTEKIKAVNRNRTSAGKRKRAMHTTYLNPYNNITIDGRYYDKRK